MAVTFPASPADGDTHVMGGISYTYDSASNKWNGISPAVIPVLEISPKAADPTERDNGSALVEGDTYYSTTDDVLKTYDGAAWNAVSTTPEFVRTNTTNPTTRSDGTALQAGDFYYNTTSENLYIYDGGGWRLNSWYNLIEPKNAAPTVRDNGEALESGDMYYHTGDEEMFIYDGAGWRRNSWYNLIRPRTTDPTARDNGEALQEGDMYYNTADNAIKTYDGAAWAAAGGGGADITTGFALMNNNINLGAANAGQTWFGSIYRTAGGATTPISGVVAADGFAYFVANDGTGTRAARIFCIIKQ